MSLIGAVLLLWRFVANPAILVLTLVTGSLAKSQGALANLRTFSLKSGEILRYLTDFGDFGGCNGRFFNDLFVKRYKEEYYLNNFSVEYFVVLCSDGSSRLFSSIDFLHRTSIESRASIEHEHACLAGLEHRSSEIEH